MTPSDCATAITLPPAISTATSNLRIVITISGPGLSNFGDVTASASFEDVIPTAEELRLRQLYTWTREAIQEAREALRKTDDDPSGVLPRRPRSEASKALHWEPKFRRRICAGSSRYRVMRF